MKIVSLLSKILVIPGIFFRKFKSVSLKKKIAIIIGMLIVLIAISQKISQLTAPPPYKTERVTKSNITEMVTEAGNIIDSGRVDVFSPTDGVILETYVNNGDIVGQGDVLFKVESSATEQEAQAAYANYLAAVSTLNGAQSNANVLRADMYAKWKQFRDLATNSTYERGDDSPDIENRKSAEFQITEDSWLAAEKKYKDQQTAIAQGQASVNSTKSLYDATQDATVKAPSSGTVSNLSITTGATVKAKAISLSTATSIPALILSKKSNNEVLIKLSETDIAKVRSGQETTIDVNAVNSKKYKGQVARVDEIGTDEQGVIIYNVYLEILDADANLRQGMTVDSQIITKKLTNVLSVPNSAIKPYQGGKAVRIPDPKASGKMKYIPVTIGVRGDKKTQILSGLKEGQEIITSVANEQIKRSGPFGN